MSTITPAQTENLYLRLEINPQATPAQIREAYRKAALKYHPDHHQENPKFYHDNFIAVSEAFEVLSDPDKRARYDSSGAVISHATPSQQRHHPEFNEEMFKFYENFFREHNNEPNFKEDYLKKKSEKRHKNLEDIIFGRYFSQQ